MWAARSAWARAASIASVAKAVVLLAAGSAGQQRLGPYASQVDTIVIRRPAGLTWFSRRNAAEAALAGLAVLGGGTRFLDWLVS